MANTNKISDVVVNEFITNYDEIMTNTKCCIINYTSILILKKICLLLKLTRRR